MSDQFGNPPQYAQPGQPQYAPQQMPAPQPMPAPPGYQPQQPYPGPTPPQQFAPPGQPQPAYQPQPQQPPMMPQQMPPPMAPPAAMASLMSSVPSLASGSSLDSIDMTNVSDDSFRLLPKEIDYGWEITAVERKPSSKGNDMITLKLKTVFPPEYAGVSVYDQVVLTDDSMWKFKALCRATDLLSKTPPYRFTGRNGEKDFIGKRLMANVYHDEYENKMRNKIDGGYRAFDPGPATTTVVSNMQPIQYQPQPVQQYQAPQPAPMQQQQYAPPAQPQYDPNQQPQYQTAPQQVGYPQQPQTAPMPQPQWPQPQQ